VGVSVTVAVRVAVRVGVNVFVGSCVAVAVGVNFIPEQPATSKTKNTHPNLRILVILPPLLFYSLSRYAHIIAHQSKYRV
jgi:hypothetical protein